MGFMDAVTAVEARLEAQSDEMVRRIVRDTDAVRSDEDGLPAVRMAAKRVLTARFRTVWESRPVADLVEYVRTMSNYQPDPVVRCHTDAVQQILRGMFPDVDDTAYDAWCVAYPDDSDGVTFPGFLAARYADAVARQAS